MVMQKLKVDGSKKRMFNHIKRLMRKQEQKDTGIKILNSSGITVNDEQEVVKEVERFWGYLFCTNGKVTLGQKNEMIGNGRHQTDTACSWLVRHSRGNTVQIVSTLYPPGLPVFWGSQPCVPAAWLAERLLLAGDIYI